MIFEEKIRSLASESLDSRVKRRVAMPLSLGDLYFLSTILDQTINSYFPSASNSIEIQKNDPQKSINYGKVLTS